MKKVSIIIPVFNASKYVSDCIESVLCQTYSNLEIIIVNDGSTDDSGIICRDIAKQDARIKYREKENGGLSSARNYAMRFVTGDLVYFLDSDDYLFVNTIESLVNEHISSGADIVSSAFTMVGENQQLSNGNVAPVFIRGDNSLFYLQIITNHACAKLYKKELFDGISYPPGMCYEDIATTFKLYDNSKCVSHTESGLYCYRVREGSITSRISKDNIADIWNAYEIIKDHYKTPDNIQKFYMATVLYTIYSRLLRSDCPSEELKKNEKLVYEELEKLDVDLRYFKDKSPMYLRLELLRMHWIKPVIKMVDLKRRLS